MSSVITAFLGTVIANIIWLVIIILLIRRVNRQQSKPTVTQEPYREPKAVCGCMHHQCFHDENGCGYSQQVYEFNSTRSPLGDTPCGCKRYTGPEPLPQVIP